MSIVHARSRHNSTDVPSDPAANSQRRVGLRNDTSPSDNGRMGRGNVAMHRPARRTNRGGHAHTAAWQVCPLVQTVPQAPQLLSELCKSTQPLMAHTIVLGAQTPASIRAFCESSTPFCAPPSPRNLGQPQPWLSVAAKSADAKSTEILVPSFILSLFSRLPILVERPRVSTIYVQLNIPFRLNTAVARCRSASRHSSQFEFAAPRGTCSVTDLSKSLSAVDT